MRLQQEPLVRYSRDPGSRRREPRTRPATTRCPRPSGRSRASSASGRRRRWRPGTSPRRTCAPCARCGGTARCGSSELSDHLHIAPRSTTEVVDALEARDLVRRRADPGDRRATLVEVTEHGAEVPPRSGHPRRRGRGVLRPPRPGRPGRTGPHPRPARIADQPAPGPTPRHLRDPAPTPPITRLPQQARRAGYRREVASRARSQAWDAVIAPRCTPPIGVSCVTLFAEGRSSVRTARR